VAKGRARTLNNLGYVYYELGDLQQAKTLCRLALQLREKLGIKYELALGYNTLGIVLDAAGNLQSASDMYSKALATFDEAQSKYGRGLVLINLGRMHRTVNDFDHAIETLLKAHDIFQRLGNRADLAEALNELACAYRDRGQPGDVQEAEQHFQDSIKLAREYGRDYLVADNFVDMAIMFGRQGNRPAAKAKLAEAAPLIETNDYIYIRSLAFWTHANMLFDEGGDLEQKGNADEAHAKFLAAFDAYLNSAAECVKNIQRGYQGRRAEERYKRVLDDIQEKLHTRPPREIPDYVERLKGRWQAKGFGEQFNELVTVCDNSLAAVQLL